MSAEPPGFQESCRLRPEICGAGDNCPLRVVAGKTPLLLKFVFSTFMILVRAKVCSVQVGDEYFN